MQKPPAEGGFGFDEETIGLGAGLFFWGYLILEIPSSISVVRKGARRVLTRVLVLWGICATLAGIRLKLHCRHVRLPRGAKQSGEHRASGPADSKYHHIARGRRRDSLRTQRRSRQGPYCQSCLHVPS